MLENTPYIRSTTRAHVHVRAPIRAQEQENDKSILPGCEKGTKPNPRGEKSRNIERLSSRNVRFCWIVSTRERGEAAIRFEKGTETVTVHPVTCAVMPICCHGRFLRFPSSLPPPFLLSFSRFTRARALHPRGTMDKLDKRYGGKGGGEEIEREGGRGEDGASAYGAGALRTDLRKNVIVRIVQDVSLSLFLSVSSFFTLFHDSLFYLPSPLLYSPVSDNPRCLESSPQNVINTKKIRTNYHRFFFTGFFTMKY